MRGEYYLLVAAMIHTPSLPSTPSISVSSWFTTRLELPPSLTN